MSAAYDVARYAVPCGLVPEREIIPERTFLSSPWARGRSYLLAREAARAVRLAADGERHLRDLDDEALSAHLTSMLPALRVPRIETETLAEALGVTREAALRGIGQRPFDEQLFAAFILLRGGLAEMATGEGKTLTAGLAGAVAAVAGNPVHVLSSNDYLVSRDADAMRPLYAHLGLRVASVTASEQALEKRAEAYRHEVVYLTPREMAFDYLRDRRALGSAGPLGRRVARIGGRLGAGLRQRGLHFAIVDEADDVLLDQARTPFVLSQRAEEPNATSRAQAALAIASDCVAGRDYVASNRENSVQLTDACIARVRESVKESDLWARPSEAREWVEMGLVALNDLTRDVDYVVRDGAVELIDAPTGRRAPDQNFARGLHQLLELKEGLDARAPNAGTARIAGQSLFRRYRKLSAMTGTAREAHAEFWRVYGLPVVRVPLRRPSMRVGGDLACYLDQEAKDKAIVSTVVATVAEGRPVLVGTDSVEGSRHIARALAASGVETEVLNAADDASEAATISHAGEARRVTVATNMAGRGADILLTSEVADNGGLHIICTRVGESRRVDRQLLGRCGRQGDPGSCETILSLSDAAFVEKVPGPLLGWARKRATASGELSTWIAQILLWAVQKADENRAEAARRSLLVLQSGRERLLAFAGRSE